MVIDHHKSTLRNRGCEIPELYKPFKQHTRNAGVQVQCDECDKWRLLFSKHKLSARERTQLQGIIADVSYLFGATIQDLILPDTLKCIRYTEP